MNNSGSDFSTVKVGDRLWVRTGDYEGWCKVISIQSHIFRPIYLELDNGFFLNCDYNGVAYSNGPQVLFYSKVEIVPPPRPKMFVKKTMMVRPYLDPHTQTIEVTSHLNCVLDYCGPAQTIEIEVEE